MTVSFHQNTNNCSANNNSSSNDDNIDNTTTTGSNKWSTWFEIKPHRCHVSPGEPPYNAWFLGPSLVCSRERHFIGLAESCLWVYFRVTRSNPTHQLTDPTQRYPVQVEKIGPNPVQLTVELTVTRYSIFIHRTYLVLLVNQASTYSCTSLIVL